MTSIADARRAVPAADDDVRLSIRFIAQMSPIVFDAPCEIVAHAEVAGEIVRGGRMKVTRLDEVATFALPGGGVD